MREVVGFVCLLFVGAVIMGALLGNSEFLNPNKHAAEIDKLAAEAEAIRARTAYEEAKHEIELQALQERRAIQRALLAPMIITGLVAGSVAALCVAGSVAYYFIIRAKALSQENGLKGLPVRDHASGPAVLTPGHEWQKGRDPGLSQIERANVSPWRATHDGLLAYCYDYMLRADSAVLFYPKGIAYDVAAFYLSVLRQARMLARPQDSCSAWALHPKIVNLDCITARISRQAFDRALAEKPIP